MCKIMWTHGVLDILNRAIAYEIQNLYNPCEC